MAIDHKPVFSVEIPEAMAEEIQRYASAESLTPEAFVQDAVKRRLLAKRNQELMQYGSENARMHHFTERDVAEKIAEFRGAAGER